MGLNHNIINFGVFLFVCFLLLDCFARQTENANRGENKQEALSFPAVTSTSIKREEIGKESTQRRDCGVPLLFSFPLWLSPSLSCVSVTPCCHSPNLGGRVEGFLAPASCSWHRNARE